MKLILSVFMMCTILEHVLAGNLTDDPELVSKALESFNSHSESWAQSVKDHFQTLSHAADTKQAQTLYRFLGALLMTGETKAIELHDAILDSFYRHDNALIDKIGLSWENNSSNAADEHILTARLKVASVLTTQLPASMQAYQEVWALHQQSLLASLTQQERSSLSLASTVGQIVHNVLIPDTLLMGMDPFQESVFTERQAIFFNPRVQFVDISAPTDYKSFLEEKAKSYPSAVVKDLLYRTFAANYGDSDPDLLLMHSGCDWSKVVNKERVSMLDLINTRNEQYNRMIFDHSCLCAVKQSFLVLQLLLKKDSFIYTQSHDEMNTIKLPKIQNNGRRKLKLIPLHIPGNMLPQDFDVETLEDNDAWFVRSSMNKQCKERSNLKRYQRTNTISEPSAAPRVKTLTAEEGRALLTNEEYAEQIEKAKTKLAELEDEGRVLDALIGAKVNRALAEVILAEAKN